MLINPSKQVSRHTVLVIGAGPGGLVATKELLEAGASDVLCLERASSFGGTFANSYDSLVFTTSASFSMFSDHWVGDDNIHHFWSKSEAIAYWGGYAERFALLAQFQFNVQVEDVRSTKDGWVVTSANGRIWECERLVIATGTNQIPRYPAWRDDLHEIRAEHAFHYREPSSFVGKRVVIVGGGESASDIALEVSAVASKTWVSLRGSAGWIVPRRRGDRAADSATHRGFWGLPRRFGPKITRRFIDRERARKDPVFDVVAELNGKITAPLGVFGTYSTKSISLARAVAENHCQIVGEVVDVDDSKRTLKSRDGITLGDVDVVLFATGYHPSMALLPKAYRPATPRHLYKHVFPIANANKLAFVGLARPAFGSQFPVMELQARWIAQVFCHGLRLPDSGEMGKAVAEDLARCSQQFGTQGERLQTLVDYYQYVDELADIIGCSPPLYQYLLRHPVLWLKIVYGPTQGTQFRLRGPGAKRSLAHDILRRLPLTPWNHVLATGLKLRARDVAERALARLGYWAPKSSHRDVEPDCPEPLD